LRWKSTGSECYAIPWSRNRTRKGEGIRTGGEKKCTFPSAVEAS
jgi:hypothetical protein